MSLRLLLALFTLLAGLASGVQAQTAAESSPPASRVELAKLAFKKMNFELMWDQMVPRMLEGMRPLVRPMLEKANVPEDKLPQLMEIMNRNLVKEFTSSRFKEEFIQLGAVEFAREFDEADLQALIAFYDSPAGRKLIDRQPLMMGRVATIGEKLGGEAGRRAGEASHAEAVRIGLLKK